MMFQKPAKSLPIKNRAIGCTAEPLHYLLWSPKSPAHPRCGALSLSTSLRTRRQLRLLQPSPCRVTLTPKPTCRRQVFGPPFTCHECKREEDDRYEASTAGCRVAGRCSSGPSPSGGGSRPACCCVAQCRLGYLRYPHSAVALGSLPGPGG